MNLLPPPVAIEEVRVDGKSAELPRRASQMLRVGPGRHQLEFRFTAMSFAAPDKVRFRYRLSEVDTDWVDAGTKRAANYGSLRPGSYRFEVTACNNDGVWNAAGDRLAFQVLPQVWETWWFQGGVGIVVLGAGAGVIRYAATRSLKRKLERLKQQRAIERDRERIARDIHDDLGAGLTQIMLQSALARRDGSQKAEVHFVQIAETARDLVRTMDEIVWAVNPENDTLDGLVTYVGKYVYDFVTLAGLRCRLKLPATLPSLPVSADVRHNLFLALKEALNNIVKHAGATEVSLQLAVEPPAFTFILRDNGHGFRGADMSDTELSGVRVSSGHGMRNISGRLEQIGGRCVVRSAPETGTEIELTVVLQNRTGG